MYPLLRKLALVSLLGLLALFSATAKGASESTVEHSEAVEHAESVEHSSVSGHVDEHEHGDLPEINAVSLAPGERLRVVASTNIIGDIVANVGGASIELTVLIPIGQNPHSYQPVPSALAAVEKAHIVFVNGFDLEEGLLDTIESTARGQIVPVSVGIDPIEDEEHDGNESDASHEGDHDHGPVDPHVWFNPNNVAIWTENIEHTLSGADPSNLDGYHERADSYLAKLDALDRSMRARFSTIPTARRKLVTDHELFGYFAREYDFEVLGAIVPGVSTSSDVSARELSRLIDLMKSEDVTVLFVGSTAGKAIEQLAESVRREIGRELIIVGMLTGSLTPPGTPGESYLSYMEYNVEQIMTALTR